MRAMTCARSRSVRPSGSLAAVALAVGMLAAASPPAPAQADPAERKRQVENSISEVQEDLAGTSAELQAAYAALAEAEARLPVAQAEQAAAEAARDEAQRKDAELATRLAAAVESEAQQAEAIEQAAAEIDETESSIGRMAARAYRDGGVPSVLELALGAQGPDEFAERYLLVDTALRSQTGMISRLEQQQAVLTNQQARLQAVREQVADLREQAAANLEVARQAAQEARDRAAEVQRLVADRASATEAIRSRHHEEEAQLAKLQAEQAALEAEIQRIAEEERRKAQERARARADRSERSDPPAPSSGGVLSRPVSGPITSSYGWRVHPIYGTRRMHTGTDFGGGCDQPIRAAAAGTVVRAGWAGGYGNQIVLNNGVIGGDAIATSYNHMSRYVVRSGSVSRGQVIGYVGTTGASTGCHLHFEVFVNGGRTNPMGYL